MRNAVRDGLALFGQSHLICDLENWSGKEWQSCFDQMKSYPLDAAEKRPNQPLIVEPWNECVRHEDLPAGLPRKKRGAIILAGGQGSRLGFAGPKGCFPILGKSLFAWHSETIAADALAIMTSPLNHDETVAFFRQNDSFGRDVAFFQQTALPFLDEAGRWFWEAPGRIAEGPDGNGSVFAAFEKSGLLRQFALAGIETVQIVPVDNVLAGSAWQQIEADLSLRCIRLDDPEEAMGRLVRMNGKMAIAEFAELSPVQRQQNILANTGLLSIDIRLFQKLAKQNFSLHWAWKTIAAWENGKTFRKFAWKRERFIVDALAYAEKARAICCPRESCYAPLKEKNSIPRIERLLLERERGK